MTMEPVTRQETAEPAAGSEVSTVDRDGVTYLDPETAREMTAASAHRWRGLLDRLAK